MIPTNKSEPKHLRIEGTSRTRKSNENSSKRIENHMTYNKEIDATMKASITRRSDSIQTSEKSKPMEQGNEKQSGRMDCPETLELIYESLWAEQKTKLPLALKL
jgi:hypothetical protein